MPHRPSRRSIVTAALAIIASLCAPALAQDKTLILTQHTFNDPGSANIPSHTVLVPKGWKADGGAFWPHPQLFRIHPTQRVTVTGPDGRFVMVSPTFAATDIFPSPEMQRSGFRRPPEGNVENGLPIRYMPADAKQWEAWVKKHGVETPFPKATNIQLDPVKPVPELTKLALKQIEPIRNQQALENKRNAELGIAMRSFSDTAVYSTRCTYEDGGRKWEQVWVWGVGVIGQDSQVGRQVWWSMEPVTTFRAPAGELQDAMPLLMTIANSVRMTPEWAGMKAQHLAKMEQIDREAFIKRSVAHAQFSQDMRNIIDQTWKDKQEAQDAAHARFIHAIRETGNYVVPNSKSPPIQLPSHFNHVWTNEQGGIILSNDANFKPGTGTTETWKQMERAK